MSESDWVFKGAHRSKFNFHHHGQAFLYPDYGHGDTSLKSLMLMLTLDSNKEKTEK
jgi:hypothetical protein